MRPQSSRGPLNEAGLDSNAHPNIPTKRVKAILPGASSRSAPFRIYLIPYFQSLPPASHKNAWSKGF